MIEMKRHSERSPFVAYSKAPSRWDRIMKIMTLSVIVTMLIVLLFLAQMGKATDQTQLMKLESVADTSDKLQLWPDPKILANNAIANRLVVAGVNCGYLDFVDNWLASLEALGITNYILIALDQNAYDVLMQTYPDHVVLSAAASVPTENDDAAAPDLGPDPEARNYGSQEFGNVVRSRPLLLLPFLKQGYTIFYSDIDTFWMKNPFDEIRQGEYDIQGATDSHPQSPDDDIGDHNICTGMLYLEATYPTIRLLEKWHEILIKINADVNQASFSDALHQWNKETAKTHNVKIKYKIAERDAYPPGYMYFKNDDRWKNKDTYVPKRSPIIVHANWVVGKKAKRKMLKDFGLWKPKGVLKPCKVE